MYPHIVHEAPFCWIYAKKGGAPENIRKLFDELAAEVERLESESQVEANERVSEMRDLQSNLIAVIQQVRV